MVKLPLYNSFRPIKYSYETVYVGTSGFAYNYWKGLFYPQGLKQKEWFSYYQTKFNSVELDVTFYRTPSFETFKKWAQESPKDFVFAVKGSLYITRYKKLKSAEESIDLFFSAAAGLGKKLSVILWQLPSNFSADTARLEKFCKELKSNPIAGGIRQAFEFRNASWFTDEVFAILKKYNFANCIADSPTWPRNYAVTADFTYLRFHGGKRLYGSKYSKKELIQWAEKIKAFQKQGLDVFAYFNNDAFAYAPHNASELINNLS